MLYYIRKNKIWQSVLLRPEYFTGTPELKIFFGDFKAVICRAQYIRTLSCELGAAIRYKEAI